ncbi:MAG TPA: LLM class flavin-dependent oxidoreductase [Acidimicrobiia bacterium]|nr:LLM class flavin-dependent oxidoreductase [Acidimicrobiia bacterium]
MALRIGLYLDLRNPPGWRRPWAAHYARSLEWIEEAEHRGAGSIWLSEHHFFEDGYLPQPLTFAAAVAARTHRVRIGTAVYLAALRPAVQIAEEAAVVDLLSGGRLELGVGAGYRVPEFEAFGADVGTRFTTVERRLVEIGSLWKSGGVTPPPVQEPIPLWAGFFGPRGARLAGRLGVGLLTLQPRWLGDYRAGLADGGHDPTAARVAGTLNLVLADDPDATRAAIAPHLAYQAESYRRYAAEGAGARPPGSYPEVEVVTPDAAAARVRRLVEALPVHDIFFWMSVAGMPDDIVDRHVGHVCGLSRAFAKGEGAKR